LKKNVAILLFIFCFACQTLKSQVNYSSAAVYGLRKVIPAYTGSAIQIRRTCDNATVNIGFTSCGDLDTVALKKFVVASNPLSAIVNTASAAYSLRRLSCTYGGSAIQVRRSSDNTLSNIGFTAAGDLDTAALKIFVGAGNGFVATWYDQSGSSLNVTQGTNARQPRIVTAGVVERKSAMPAIRFISANSSSLSLNAPLMTDRVSVNVVASVNSASIRNAIVDLGAVTGSYPDFTIEANTWSTAGNRWGLYANNNSLDAAAVTSTLLTVITVTAINTFTSTAPVVTNTGYYVNGILYALNCRSCLTNNYPSSWPNGMSIGNFNGNFAAHLNGYLNELIIFPVAISGNERQYIEWSQAEYYGISGPVLTALPATPQSGYILTWYDQSGFGFNASPTVTATQPIIVTTGSIEKNGTIPAIRFNASQIGLVAGLPVSAYPISISAIANTSGASTNGAFVKLGGIDNVNNTTAGIGIGVGANNSTFDNSGTSVVGLKEWVTWAASNPVVTYPSTPFAIEAVHQNAAGGSGFTAYLNGTTVSLNNATSGVGATITGSLYVGGYRNQTDRFPVVKESEVTIFGSALNATRRRLLEANQAAYYAITVTGNKYTPPAATAYQRYVLGIGRESAADSVAGTRASIGMGFTVSTNASAFLKDNGDYLTAGINCTITATTSTSFITAPVLQRWDNDWYINKTDVSSNNGTLTVYFSFSDYQVTILPGVAVNYRLLARISTASNFSVVASAVASVSGDRVYFNLDASAIANTGYYTIGTIDPSSSPLPVELVEFKGTCKGDAILLSWTTATERNNDYFLVERSTDGESWTGLPRISGAGTSPYSKEYSFTDPTVSEQTLYYKLSQVDFDGKKEIFKTIDIVCNSFEDKMTVYPNPASKEITLQFNLSKNYGKGLLKIIDSYGRVCLQQTTDLSKGSSSLLMSLNLSPGTYCVLVSSENLVLPARKLIIN